MSGILPHNLLGVDFEAGQLAVMLDAAPDPYATWVDFLNSIHPRGLTVVPIWYVTVVTDALRAGHITDTQARSLLTADVDTSQVGEPTSMLTAWSQLMQLLAVTWPARRRAASAATLRMNTAVTKARKVALRG